MKTQNAKTKQFPLVFHHPSNMQLSSALCACFLVSLLCLSTTDASRNAGVSQAKISMDRHHRVILPRAGAVVTKKAPDTEGASIPNEIFNLVKSIVGAGVFGLPAGIAAFGNAPSALLPAAALMTFFGILSFYGFSLIGRICSFTGAKNYREAWSKSVSEQTSWLPALCCLLVTTCSVLAYSMILSDTIPKLLETVGIVITRTQALIGITATVLLPLCMLKEMKKLAPFSLVGIIGMCYTAIAMLIRYFGKAYAVGGQFLETMPTHLRPSFGNKGAASALNSNTFLLISMLSTAYMAHYNAPKFYLELRNNTIPRYMIVVGVSYLISILMFLSVASLGFLTFGEASSGLVLNNYSTSDKLMSVSRVAVALSLIFSYPLAFGGVRDGVLDFAKVPVAKRTDRFLNMLTLGLLAIISCMAYVVRDLTVVFAFGGATWGNALIYLFPTFMLMQCAKKMPQLKKEVPIAAATGLLGLMMGVIGTIRAVKSALSK
jgi:amino acid permease